MKFDLKKPCDNCPFRTDLARPFPLAEDRVREITSSLYRGQTFACHKTTEECGAPGSKEQHCAGALLFMDRAWYGEGGLMRGQLGRIMARLGGFDPDGLDDSVPTYESVEEMVEACSGGE
jgi:hypothetical protein